MGTMENLAAFTVTYTPIKDGRWKAQCSELPEAAMQGETLEEARELIRWAVSMLLEVRREKAKRGARKKGAIREPLLRQPVTEPGHPKVLELPPIEELPREVAFALLTLKMGYTADRARHTIANARGEWEDDVVGETEAETEGAG